MNNNSASIDLSIIQGLIGDDAETIRIFFKKFVDTATPDLIDIKKHIDDHEFDSIKSRVHKLKSSAKAIGAIEFAEICQKIEDTSAQKEIISIADLFNDLTQEFKNCSQYIKNY